MQRIHGKLLIYTGILHTLFSFIPGIFGEQLVSFAKHGFFNISKGLFEFSLFGGDMRYDVFAAFWFFYIGPVIIFIGILIDHIELIVTYIPRKIIVSFFIISLIGAFMIPISGMTIFLLPQSIYMYLRTKRIQSITHG
jgi:hypothetical protein